MKLEMGLEKGMIHKEQKRIMPLPDGNGYERKSLIDGWFFILMLVEAKACLQL